MKRVLLILLLPFVVIEYSYSQNFLLKQANDVYIMYGLCFELGSREIRTENFELLDSIAAFLTENKQLCIEVGIHSDERFSKKLSVNYSAIRAQAIVDYLISKGVGSDKLVAKGYCSAKPLIKGAKTEEEHQLNRRTEFTVLRNDCEQSGTCCCAGKGHQIE